MPSEELLHRYPENTGKKIGDYEVFQTQLVTLSQFAEHGILENVSYGKYASQKPDAIIISRSPILRCMVIGEDKAVGKITSRNWKAIAKNLLITKLNTTKALLGYVTDQANTYWICGNREDIQLVVRENGKPMPTKIDFKDKSFVAELTDIIQNYDDESGEVKRPISVNPAQLARSMWQTIWRLKADRPEDCLATFVELFLYKFLNDLGLMTKNNIGQSVSLDYLLQLEKHHCYSYYWNTVRPYIKELFPQGADGYSIINGIVLQPSNRDHNFIFHTLLEKFVKFGSLKNTNPSFKTNLYESFLQESDTTTTFGQFFTPRKVVGAIHDMAQIENLTHGSTICDPACGVGGFLLEQMARDLASQWGAKGNTVKPIHNWRGIEIVPKTAILAKANALVHCGDILANQPARIKSFAKWLNEAFICKDQTSLGSLDDRSKEVYDVILTNPPFVVSGSADIGKLINSSPERKKYFSRKYSGVEGLFIQFIVQSLKKNGHAWILLPETFFLRTNDKVLRDWIFQECQVDLLALLPERTFFNTPKRVVIVHLKKRSCKLSEESLRNALLNEKVLLFALSEIGETRDARRFPIEESDLPDLVATYKLHSVGASIPASKKKAVIAVANDLKNSKSINIRHYWDKSVAQDLGLLGEDEDPIQAKKQLDIKMQRLRDALKKWEAVGSKALNPPPAQKFKTVFLGDEDLFGLSIGRRVLKKEIFQKQTGIPIFSANVRKPFGYSVNANAGNLFYGGTLWSIDSDFDCIGVSPGEVYTITDHCGQLEIKVDGIEPRYLASQIRQAGIDQGLSRDYRSSLKVMAEIEIELPIKKDGSYDYELMKTWADFQDRLEHTELELHRLMKDD